MNSLHNGSNGTTSVEDQFSNLSLKGKKKRPARAYHDLSVAAIEPQQNNQHPQQQFQQQPQQQFQQNPQQQQFQQTQQQFVQQHQQHHHHPQVGQQNDSPLVQEINPGNQTFQESLSVPNKRYNDQKEYMVETEDTLYLKPFLTFENAVSPTSGTQYASFDQGTASSKFMRSTMYNIPENDQLRQASKLPVAVTIRPFAPLLDSEEPIPVVDMRELGKGNLDDDDVGPVRCRRCRTYMNPSIQHTFNNKFTCNICHFANNVTPQDYSSMINPTTNQRVDVAHRPELHKGVYDILVPKAYNFGGPETTPECLHHVILVDISINSIRNNLPSLVADTIRSTLFSGDDDIVKRKFAIILFDKRMHFYNLSHSLDATQVTISSDLDDPFVPFYNGLFADVEDSRMVIEDALNDLEEMVNNDALVTDDETCLSVALRTAMMCLAEVGGGKITTLLSAMPTWGPGALKFKNDKTQAARLSPEVQKQLFNPDNEYYKLLAKDFIKENVGVDCFIISNAAVDLSNIGWLCSVTGGSCMKWSNFQYERDARDFSAKFTNSIIKTKAYQGQLKLRCSNGLQVSQYYGTSSSISEISVVGANTQDPILPIISEDKTYTVLLEYDGQLSTKNDCHFQAALLYTDIEGNRKVRVINLVLAVSERLNDIFHFVDQDSVVTTIVRDTLSFFGKQTISELRDSLNDKLVEIFTQYRAKSELGHNSARTLTNQLLLPDSLSTLPMYILSFLKSNALKESNNISIDSRLEDVYQMLNMPMETLMYHLYPALVELHSLEGSEGLIPESETNIAKFVNLPKYKELSLFKLEEGVYIMCNGKRILVYVRQHSNPLLLKDLFGQDIDSIDQIDTLNDELPELPTGISEKARNIIEFFNRHIIGLPIGSFGIQVVRENTDGSDLLFKEQLFEDGAKLAVSVNSSSYTEYLTRLHKAIKSKLENDKTYSKVKDSISQAEHSNDTLAQRFIQF